MSPLHLTILEIIVKVLTFIEICAFAFFLIARLHEKVYSLPLLCVYEAGLAYLSIKQEEKAKLALNNTTNVHFINFCLEVLVEVWTELD